MKNIYLKKAFCGALAAGVAIAGLNAPVQTDAKTTTKKKHRQYVCNVKSCLKKQRRTSPLFIC